MKLLHDVRDSKRPPFLSVVVPCHNVESVVLETLDSLLIATQGRPVECLLIEDGSNDETLAVLRHWITQGPRLGFALWSQPNHGLSVVRNRGAAMARGQWLAFLDSDDRVTAEGFRALWEVASATSSDLILGGAQIIEGTGTRTPDRPFYHETVWTQLLKGASRQTVTAIGAPAIFALEPNVNYRWIRRDFYQSAGLEFPEGLLFEDLPVHFRMLRKARAIDLVAAPYYLYRVHRPGKITESRDLRRFDALKTLELAIEELRSPDLSQIQGAHAVRSVNRLAWGCGRMIPDAGCLDYFKGLSARLSRLPLQWRWQTLTLKSRDRWTLHLLMALPFPWLLALISRLPRLPLRRRG